MNALNIFFRFRFTILDHLCRTIAPAVLPILPGWPSEHRQFVFTPLSFPPSHLPLLSSLCSYPSFFLRSSSPSYVFLRLHRVASRDSSSSSIILNDRSCWRSNWFSQTSDSSQADAAGGGEGERAAREGVNVRRREANGKWEGMRIYGEKWRKREARKCGKKWEGREKKANYGGEG